MPVWRPQLGFQIDALETRAFVFELHGGGPRGGGKSDWLLADFAADIHELGKEWKGILFRRTYSQFRELIDRSREMFTPLSAKFNESQSGPNALTWRFPRGASLKFFHMERDEDIYKHLGIQYQWVGWDELPHWPNPEPYLKMLSTVRSPVKGLMLRVRSTGNPGGPGLGWIRKRFKIRSGRDPGRRLIIDEKTGLTRMFIRSELEENKIMLEANPNYKAVLMASVEGNEQLKKAWIDGDYNVFFGQFFPMFEPSVHRVDPNIIFPGGTVPKNWRIYGSLDYGEAKPTAFLLWAMDEHGRSICLAEHYEGGLWAAEHAAKIQALCRMCPYTDGRMPEKVWCDPSLFYVRSQAGSASMSRKVADIFKAETGLKLMPSNRDRIAGWRFLKNLLAWKEDDKGKIVKLPKIFYVPECSNFERTMKDAVHAGGEDNPKEDMDTEGEDHIPDAVRYYVMGAVAPSKSPPKPADTGMTFNYHMEAAAKRRRGLWRPAEAPMIIPQQPPQGDDVRRFVEFMKVA